MEEDIKIVENLINVLNTGLCKFGENVQMSDCGYQQAIEYLLKRNYLENEARKIINQELNKAQIDLYKNYIPISVIQNKITPVIDELEKDGFVGYADELRDILDEILEKGNK